MNQYNRRKFIKRTAVGSLALSMTGNIMKPDSANISLSDKENYEWINYARIFIVDGYGYPLYPEIEFDAEKMAEAMADMHANVLRIATSGRLDWLIPGTEFTPAAELGSRDLLSESVAACKPRGIKVLPYVQCGASMSERVMKPGWEQIVSPDGRKSAAVCWNTPYRKAFFNLIETIVSKYDVDGVYFDSWLPFYSFEGQVCYCEGCRNGFRESTGKELPYRERRSDYTREEARIIELYRVWYTEKLYDAFSETKRIIKSYKNIPLIYNINNPSRILDKVQNNTRIMQESDAFLYERGKSMIERAEGVSLATAHKIVVWPYVGTYDPYPRIPHFNEELIQEIFTSVAFGGSPVLYHTYFFTGYPESRKPVTEAFKIIEKNNAFLNGYYPEKYCAVVWNDKDPAGHASKGYLWDTDARSSSLGAFSACLKNHIQTTSLLKIDLDNPEILNSYKVLYLPDICYLTESQIRNVTSFVENGGGLVMSYSTSLYDEEGKHLPDFALGKIAGIKYRKPDEDWVRKMKDHYEFGSTKDVYLKTVNRQNVIKPALANGLIPAHVFETVEALPGSEIIANLVTRGGKDVVAPGLIISPYGKGKVAYISSEIGSMYLQTGIKEFSDFIKNVIEYVSPEPEPYDLEAPHSTLLGNMMVNGNKRVLHIVNWPGSQAERMWQNLYHIPPVENVTVKFRVPAGKKVNKVSSFIRADFSQRQEKDILYITFPEIKNYQGVVIEMI
jgi:hypothetical protein